MKIKLILLIVICSIAVSQSALYAQVLGNQVYNFQNRNQNQRSTASHGSLFESVCANDSTLQITGKILMNVEADEYLAVFGVSQEGLTSSVCNSSINQRIDGFKEHLSEFGVTEEDVYVDMITQNVVFDYKIEDKQATQYKKGFEIKKNVIFRFKNIEDLDKILVYAAKYDIYDIVKVDYVILDIEKLYERLFEEAVAKIKMKKRLYIGATDLSLEKASLIRSEHFNIIFPKELYRKYQAYESSSVHAYYSSNWVKKESRKRNTFFYDQLDAKGYDKLINPVNVKVGVQVVFELKIQYKIKK